MSGYVHIHRSLWDHPVFQAFDEASAFAWMISNAAWRPTRVRYKNNIIDLDRSELAVSNRDMADRIGWSEAKARRFLKRLAYHEMIEVRSDAGVNVVTICNYEKFQASGKSGDAPPTHHPTRTRRTTRRSSDAERDAPPDLLSFGYDEEIPDDRDDGDAPRDAEPTHHATQQRRSGDAQNKDPKKGRIDSDSTNVESLPVAAVKSEGVDDSIKRACWDIGKSYLAPLVGKRATPMIGKWLKDNSHTDVLEALRRAERERTQDPIPFITAVLNRADNHARDGPESLARRDQRQNSRTHLGLMEMAKELDDGGAEVDPGKRDGETRPAVPDQVRPGQRR